MVTAWCSTFSSLAGRPTGTRLCRNDPSSSWSGGWLNGRSSTTEETGGLWYTACKFNTHTDAKVKHVEIDLMIKYTSTFKTKSHIHTNTCTHVRWYMQYMVFVDSSISLCQVVLSYFIFPHWSVKYTDGLNSAFISLQVPLKAKHTQHGAKNFKKTVH